RFSPAVLPNAPIPRFPANSSKALILLGKDPATPTPAPNKAPCNTSSLVLLGLAPAMLPPINPPAAVLVSAGKVLLTAPVTPPNTPPLKAPLATSLATLDTSP